MKQTFLKGFLVLFFALGTLQPLLSLARILLYGRLFEYNFTYLRAAKTALAGKSIYSFGDINYPPPALFLFIPFRFLPVFWGQIIWSAVSLGCLLLALYFSFKALKLAWKWQNLYLVLPLTFLAFPVKWTFGLGQINNLILLLLVLGFFFYQRDKFTLSGFILGVATALKIVPGVFLFYFDLPKSPMTIG
ncbi:MAG: glycosyltransferase family 87 protein, partial [Microgenomates group bacterium]